MKSEISAGRYLMLAVVIAHLIISAMILSNTKQFPGYAKSNLLTPSTRSMSVYKPYKYNRSILVSNLSKKFANESWWATLKWTFLIKCSHNTVDIFGIWCDETKKQLWSGHAVPIQFKELCKLVSLSLTSALMLSASASIHSNEGSRLLMIEGGVLLSTIISIFGQDL